MAADALPHLCGFFCGLSSCLGLLGLKEFGLEGVGGAHHVLGLLILRRLQGRHKGAGFSNTNMQGNQMGMGNLEWTPAHASLRY